jgi:putative nucleotidyltransferase with HDIG domain
MPVKKKKVTPSRSKKSSEAFAKIRSLESEISIVIQEMEQTVRHFDCLSQFASLVASDASREDLIHEAQKLACELLQCEAAIVDLFDAPVAVALQSKAEERRVKSVLQIPLKIGQNTLGSLQVMNKVTLLSAVKKGRALPSFDLDDQRLLEELGKQLAVGLENSRLKLKLKKSFAETVDVLAEAIEKKDRYTGGHTKRVAYYAVLIAKHLNLNAEQSEVVRLAAVLHDVGKIGIEDRVLKKRAPLDEAEWVEMKTHPQLGFEIMSRMEGAQEAIDGAHYHHERWDGTGYPRGLKGEEIPLTARIVSLADAYDALTSNRPYRDGVEPALAYEEILRSRGTQFDPRIVDAFIEAFHVEKMGKGSGGSNR